MKEKLILEKLVMVDPAPPDKEHTYIFKLYALDNKLTINEGASKSDVEKSMKNHILAETKLEGKYAP